MNEAAMTKTTTTTTTTTTTPSSLPNPKTSLDATSRQCRGRGEKGALLGLDIKLITLTMVRFTKDCNSYIFAR